MGGKHGGKRSNCLLRAISHFYHSVFKRLVLRTRKNLGLFGKGLMLGIKSAQLGIEPATPCTLPTQLHGLPNKKRKIPPFTRICPVSLFWDVSISTLRDSFSTVEGSSLSRGTTTIVHQILCPKSIPCSYNFQ